MIANYAIPPHFSSRFGTSKLGALRKIIKACNRKNEDDLALAVDEFNDILMGVVDEMDQAGDDWKQKSSSGGGSSNNFEDSSSKIHDHGDDDDDDDKLLVEKRDWVSPPTGNPFLFVEHVLEQSYSRAVTPFADQLKVKGKEGRYE